MRRALSSNPSSAGAGSSGALTVANAIGGTSGRGIHRGAWCFPGRSPATGDTIHAEGASTRVDLEHRLLRYYGGSAAQMRGIFDSEQGWTGLLDAYAVRASAA
jgi:hypothetical protein